MYMTKAATAGLAYQKRLLSKTGKENYRTKKLIEREETVKGERKMKTVRGFI